MVRAAEPEPRRATAVRACAEAPPHDTSPHAVARTRPGRTSACWMARRFAADGPLARPPTPRIRNRTTPAPERPASCEHRRAGLDRAHACPTSVVLATTNAREYWLVARVSRACTNPRARDHSERLSIRAVCASIVATTDTANTEVPDRRRRASRTAGTDGYLGHGPRRLAGRCARSYRGGQWCAAAVPVRTAAK
jgi:hypothetical protein